MITVAEGRRIRKASEEVTDATVGYLLDDSEQARERLSEANREFWGILDAVTDWGGG